MWRSVFLHEFIDHRIANFQAAPGAPTPPSLTLTPTRDLVPGVNAVEITPGKGFEYMLTTPLQQVIGISCRVRVSYPITPQAHLFPVMRLGSVAELLLWPMTHPLGDLSGTSANVRVRIGNPYVNLGRVDLPARTFTDLRFDWHTSGQARVLADGRLLAYHNAVAPGASLSVDRVVFGLPSLQPPATHPRYIVARVFVRVLLRSDALAQFTKLLPDVKVAPEDVNRCRLRATANLLAMVDKLRHFMASVNQTLSQPWSLQTGSPDGPFRPEAKRAHNLATASLIELSKILRTGDYSEPDRFLDPFTQFLEVLRDALPAQFSALAAELGGTQVVPDDCKAVLEAALEQNKSALGPVIALLSAASDRVKQVSEGV